jgi:hypothetical protein
VSDLHSTEEIERHATSASYTSSGQPRSWMPSARLQIVLIRKLAVLNCATLILLVFF